MTIFSRNYYACTRRSALAGMAGLAITGPSFTADPPPIAHGILENNLLAQAFEKPPAAKLPDIKVVGLDGEKPLSEIIKGRTVLLPVWAEWCAPCLAEIPDFARLQQKYGNEKFAVIPVLSSPLKRVTPPIMKQFLTILHAEVFEPYIEKNLGSRLAMTMGKYKGSFALPCNLIIDSSGRVVGREIGIKRDEDDPSHSSAKNSKELIARAEAGDNLSLWGKPAGEEFAQAMANGFLEPAS